MAVTASTVPPFMTMPPLPRVGIWLLKTIFPSVAVIRPMSLACAGLFRRMVPAPVLVM